MEADGLEETEHHRLLQWRYSPLLSKCPGCTGPVEEGSILARNVPEPHSSGGQLVQGQPRSLPRRQLLVVVLEQQGGQKDPRLQDHVVLLGPQQPVGRVIYKVLDVLAGPPGDVSGAH